MSTQLLRQVNGNIKPPDFELKDYIESVDVIEFVEKQGWYSLTSCYTTDTDKSIYSILKGKDGHVSTHYILDPNYATIATHGSYEVLKWYIKKNWNETAMQFFGMMDMSLKAYDKEHNIVWGLPNIKRETDAVLLPGWQTRVDDYIRVKFCHEMIDKAQEYVDAYGRGELLEGKMMDRLVQFRCEMRALALEHIDWGQLWWEVADNRINIRRGIGRPLKESQIIDDKKKLLLKDKKSSSRCITCPEHNINT